MYLENIIYNQICSDLGLSHEQPHPQQEKLKKSISVLHNRYLMQATKEAKHLLRRSQKPVEDPFALIMNIYNKKIREHQSLFLLLHLFEIAIRSKTAITISNHYSSDQSDDWFLSRPPKDAHHHKLQEKIRQVANHKHFSITTDTTSFDLFNLLSMGDLEWILKTCWSLFLPLFQKKSYKQQTIPAITTKTALIQKFSKVRSARNDIFHNNPPKMKRGRLIEDIELLLLHLGYNLHDAINNIDPEHKIIKLKYTYTESS